MPGNRFNGFTNLGIGIGLRVKHYSEILERFPAIDWFEIISENYMVDGGRPLQILDRIVDRYPVVQHGVSLYFGSADPYDEDHLRRLKCLTQRTRTPFVSDHLCWGSVDGKFSHDLLPMPYTREAVRNTVSRIKQVRDYLELPVCIENISSYLEFNLSEMTEWQFLSEVAHQADCGILLDVNNVFVAATNHNFDPYQYLDAIELERVAQIHLAGHTVHEKYLLDTHDHPVADPVWKLYEYVVSKTGPVNTLLEWDASIPSFDEVHAEARKAAHFIEQVGKRNAYGQASA